MQASRAEGPWRYLAVLGLALSLALAPQQARADFGVSEFGVTYEGADNTPATQAGSHSFDLTTAISFTSHFDPDAGRELLGGDTKDFSVQLPAGLALDRSAVPFCPYAGFVRIDRLNHLSSCPDAAAVGILGAFGASAGNGDFLPIYSLQPPPGVLARFGFVAFEIPVFADIRASTSAPYGLAFSLKGLSNLEPLVGFGGFRLTLWGEPASPAHDAERGNCALTGASCPAGLPRRPYLTLPRSCTGPLPSSYAADSWQDPGALLADGEPDLTDPSWLTGASESPGLSGCGRLGFAPAITAKPTTLAAGSPSGLDFSIEAAAEGLQSSAGLAAADLRGAAITLPQGFTVNPSLAAGLEVCSRADLKRESAFSAPGAGCPDASKIGTAAAGSPLLPGGLSGALYLAAPYENPSGSLIALYLVIRSPSLGILVRQPLEVKADPRSGRLTTIARDLPQIPLSDFKLHLREGARSPLVSPPACGAYEASAILEPSSAAPPLTVTSAFQIIAGPDSGPCPPAGLPPFKPGLAAGTLSNAAGRFSPFSVRLSRSDPEQEITHFSVKLAPGLAGRLAGIPYCSEAQIAAAKARSGPHGGQEELNSPSCPAASQVGRTLAGSGAGAALAYAPGKLYLAGPYRGSAISLVAITAARIGPFDLGTIVVRQAFRVDPATAAVFLDATGSDPVPHIVKGIPLRLRDIRAYAERPGFVLNPTSCRKTSVTSTLLGSGLDFGSAADDRPVAVSTPFQAAGCAALAFKPRLALELRGGSRRGDHPSLRATLRMGGLGEAGIRSAQLTLPRSEFIASSHFKTICTRAQFSAGAHPGEKCPAGSLYGSASAQSPLLEQPLSGPVFLRSSEQKLPDVAAVLRNGQVDIVLAGRLDSVKGRLRASFEGLPDAPVEWVSFRLWGAGKGLFENSAELCRASHRALASLSAHNGMRRDFAPEVKATGCAPAAAGHKRRRAASR